jgi:hypothetical protein
VRCKKTVFGPPGASKTQWRSLDIFPFHFGFCPNKTAWDRDMKRLNMTCDYPTSDGNCAYFVNDGLKGGAACIVTLGERKKWNGIGIVGLLVHEAAHVWQRCCEHVGEEKPSAELEAYAMQLIVEELIEGYVMTRGRIPTISQKR